MPGCVCDGVAAEAPVSDQDTHRGPDFDEFVASEFTNILALALALLHDRDDAVDVARKRWRAPSPTGTTSG